MSHMDETDETKSSHLGHCPFFLGWARLVFIGMSKYLVVLTISPQSSYPPAWLAVIQSIDGQSDDTKDLFQPQQDKQHPPAGVEDVLTNAQSPWEQSTHSHCYPNRTQRPRAFEVWPIAAVSAAAAAQNRRHRLTGNQRDLIVCCHKCRTVTCDVIHSLLGSFLPLTLLFPSTTPVRAGTHPSPILDKRIPFFLSSSLFEGEEVGDTTASQPEVGLGRSASFALFDEEIKVAIPKFSGSLLSFTLQMYHVWFQHGKINLKKERMGKET